MNEKHENVERVHTHTHTHTGITLIALIITIIVLLILAAVTINMVLGENGLFRKVKEAKEIYLNSQVAEEETMNKMEKEMEIASLRQVGGNATSDKILKDYTAYVDGNLVTGNIESLEERTWIPTTSDQTIEARKYLNGTQTIKGDSNLIPANIKRGTSIFGVSGTYTGTSEYINVKCINVAPGSTNGNSVATTFYPADGFSKVKLVCRGSLFNIGLYSINGTYSALPKAEVCDGNEHSYDLGGTTNSSTSARICFDAYAGYGAINIDKVEFCN